MDRIEKYIERLGLVELELGQPGVTNDQKLYKKLTQEYAHLSRLVTVHEKLQKIVQQLKENEELLSVETDPDFIKVLNEDVEQLRLREEKYRTELQTLLVPPDPNDHRNTILEIRAGTGGDEAALFVADCVRMYQMFASQCGWTVETLSSTPSDIGGFKDYVMVFSGQNVYRFLRNEGGTHRVQRVPETETQGRVHTSAITVAVMLEPEAESEVVVEEKDLRIDTYRSSGAGGQHVNVTDSAVRLTHIPTGIVVCCQDERSQHKNKDKAMRLLKAKISEARIEEAAQERASSRAAQVGSGDRSERIRTYNFPQNRITDHRIQFTEHNLDRFMEGQMDRLIQKLVSTTYQTKSG